MDSEFFCPSCKTGHDSPAHAQLGYPVLCMDCALEIDLVAYRAGIIAVELPQPDDSAVAA